jgi:hypothetical protein
MLNVKSVPVKEPNDLWVAPVVANLRPLDHHHTAPGTESVLRDIDKTAP